MKIKEQILIDKIAYLFIKDGKILATLSKGKDTWYLPGGKRETGESDEQTLIREVKEELSVDLKPETIRFYGRFEAQAHGKPKGVSVRMTCYTADFNGEIEPAAEIGKVMFLNHGDNVKKSPVDYLIFDDLHTKGLLQ